MLFHQNSFYGFHYRGIPIIAHDIRRSEGHGQSNQQDSVAKSVTRTRSSPCNHKLTHSNIHQRSDHCYYISAGFRRTAMTLNSSRRRNSIIMRYVHHSVGRDLAFGGKEVHHGSGILPGNTDTCCDERNLLCNL